MKVKVPSKIQVGSHTYTVKLSRQHLEDEDTRGIINYRTQEIVINAITPDSRKTTAFIHEIIHLSAKIFGIILEEEEINRLCEGLGQGIFSSLGIELDWSKIEKTEES